MEEQVVEDQQNKANIFDHPGRVMPLRNTTDAGVIWKDGP